MVITRAEQEYKKFWDHTVEEAQRAIQEGRVKAGSEFMGEKDFMIFACRNYILKLLEEKYRGSTEYNDRKVRGE